MARAFLKEGAKVVLIGRNQNKLKAVCEELGDNAFPLAMDVTDRAQVETMLPSIMEKAGGLDIFCPNAGSFVSGSVLNGDVEAWKKVFDVNVQAVFETTHAVLPHLIEQKQGDIIFMGSVAGMKPFGICPIYCGAKAAIHNFADSLAEDIAGKGVRICTLAPGPVETKLLEDWDQEVLEQVRENGKLLLPEDIANAAVFVAGCPPHVRIPIMNIMPAGDVREI